MVDLLGLFHNYSPVVELILELFCEAAKRCICYLGQSDSRMLPFLRKVMIINTTYVGMHYVNFIFNLYLQRVVIYYSHSVIRNIYY